MGAGVKSMCPGGENSAPHYSCALEAPATPATSTREAGGARKVSRGPLQAERSGSREGPIARLKNEWTERSVVVQRQGRQNRVCSRGKQGRPRRVRYEGGCNERPPGVRSASKAASTKSGPLRTEGRSCRRGAGTKERAEWPGRAYRKRRSRGRRGSQGASAPPS